jgi:hypothetical protein
MSARASPIMKKVSFDRLFYQQPPKQIVIEEPVKIQFQVGSKTANSQIFYRSAYRKFIDSDVYN